MDSSRRSSRSSKSSNISKRSSRSSNISKKNTKKINERELKKFLEYLYIDALLNCSPNEYDSIISKYLNKVTKIQPPLLPLQPLPPIKEEEDSREDSEKYGPPVVPTEEQNRRMDESLKKWNKESQTSRPRTQVTKEHMEEARVFDQNNNFEIPFLKK